MTKSKDTSQKALLRSAKAIEKRAEQLEVVKAPIEKKAIRFHQPDTIKLYNKFPIMADRLTLKIGNKILLKDTSFQFPLGNTIAITGENGSGKTTLFRHILQNGDGITISSKATIGSYDQIGYKFGKAESVISFLKKNSEYNESKILSVLHEMSFTGNDVKKSVHQLSGGEAIRLVLCELFLGKYNVLVLDEPTNFLDVYCIEALERFLDAYEGTVLLVSHDHMFIDRVADYVYVIENQQLRLRR